MTTLRVGIVGGGTGGLCLAHGLRRAGVEVAVYERSRSRTERLQGYRVHISPHGSQALHACLPPSLWERFVATAGQPGVFGFLTEQLRELLVIDGEPEPDPARAHHSVSRITLHQVLSAELDGILHYDKEFVRYTDGGRRLCFADGTEAEADVLVGADGANSRVRAQFLPHAKRVDTGILAIAGKLPLRGANLPSRLADGPNMIMPRRDCGMFTAPHQSPGVDDETAALDPGLFGNTEGYLMWSFAARRPFFGRDMSELDGAGIKAVVGELIRDWHPELGRIVADSPDGTVTLLPILSSEPVAPWEPGRVTLLGDAAHSMTPFRGIGANIALRDAELLCAELSRGGPSAIGAYEERMRDYGFAAVRASRKSAEQFVSGNAAGRLAFRGVLRFLTAVPPLKRRAFAEQGND
ncbi:NAD(P)/FAD-dependent oxidoreductase [Amycolatopsis sp. YIM 10]|uniref:FAD-dependent oxidoreductase n=1 Tax=Amycolatopsis sp. YIM 10 TaxID=2653857 RepID=UPI00128FDAC2|nr:NAD(P)/FAD-dependent oxidoreductase [Amycolatopsis sp. YIM 10]QFU92866.1 6-hydroxynicotinate 3-monooxygenase precursor [Amycolatopsis sp. YIM 10]